MRAEAQLQLSQMHCYTRPTQVRNRCIMGGKTRGILRDFKMSRVSCAPESRGVCVGYVRGIVLTAMQYNFRVQALDGNLPGVKKASW